MRENTLSPISCFFPWCCCWRQRSSGGWLCNRKQRRCSEKEDKSHKQRSCQGAGFGVAGPFSKASQQLFWRHQTALGMGHQEQQLLDPVVQDWSRTGSQPSNHLSQCECSPSHRVTAGFQRIQHFSINYGKNITNLMSVAIPSPGECCWLPFSKQSDRNQALHPSNLPHLFKNSIKWGFRDGHNFSTTLPWNKKLNHVAPGKRPAFNGIKCP